MRFTSFTALDAEDRAAMLAGLGCSSMDELFSHIPASMQSKSFGIPEGCSEIEARRRFRALAAQNAIHCLNFCGGGFYDHDIPAAVDALASRGEFYTPYTPYQPEASQGTLQAIYEYQTAMARLTGMEAANASLYDGGTALFEGVMMALRITRRSKVLVDGGVNPVYREMLRTHFHNHDEACEDVPLKAGQTDAEAIASKLGKDTAVVILQNPNFFGSIADHTSLIGRIHEAGAVALMSVYPLSLGILKTPGDMGADIVTGEGQSLGLPLSFGGPYLGFMATLMKHIRSMPGRIVGETTDAQGRRGFVLTLQAREQHIRREKATSNICSNEAHCALRALLYLALKGRAGLVQTATQCWETARYARDSFAKIPGASVKFPTEIFNEFVLHLPVPAAEIVEKLLQEGIACGIPLSRWYHAMKNDLLVAFTEKHTRQDVDALAQSLREALAS